MTTPDKEIGNNEDTIEKENKNQCNSDIDLIQVVSAEGNDQSRSDYANEDSEKADIVSKKIIALRSSIYKCYTRNPKYWKYIFYFALNIVAIGYLIAVVKIYYEKGHNIEYWKGFGLLIILYSLIYGGLLYFLVVKRYFRPKISKTFLKPLGNFGIFIWNIKLFKFILCLVPLILISVYLFFEYENIYKKKFISVAGILAFLLFGYVFSASPGHVKWKTVISGLVFQFLLGLLTLKWKTGIYVLEHIGSYFTTFLNFSQNGTEFVYGPLVKENFEAENGKIFAFTALPVIFFFSFVISILSYYNILQWVILKLAWVIQMLMGTTVCESVSAIANIFIGGIESMLLFKNQIKDLTRSELHTIMCAGLASVAGTVLAGYISFGINPTHLLVASFMSAPASLSYSKLFYPEREKSKTTFKNIVLVREEGHNVLDAACRGAVTGIAIVGSIIACIIAFLAFLAFLDSVVHWLGILIDFPSFSFQYVLTQIYIPIAYLMGIDDESIEDVALLLGTKTFATEFRAYELMSTMQHKFSERTKAITTFALCGFSNFSSLGVFAGVVSSLEPSQTASIAEISARAFISANIVCYLTACIAGTLLDM